MASRLLRTLAGASAALVLALQAQAASWQTLSDTPSTGRHLHTVTSVGGGFTTPQVLVAGGRSCSSADPASCVDLADAARIHGLDDEWGLFGTVVLPPMNVARAGHAATQVLFSNLLVAGGISPAAGTSAEIWKPLFQQWETVGSLSYARAFHTLTPAVVDYYTLAAGGCSGTPCVPVAVAELYDSRAKTWGTTGALKVPRYRHTATLMPAPNGYVLVAGGLTPGRNSTASAELYDPILADWIPTGAMLEARSDHTAAVVRVGGKLRVLVVGGENCVEGVCTPLASAELYDPFTGSWTPTASMSVPRTGHASVALSSCQTLVAGGSSSGAAVASAEIYDQITGTWSATAPMAEARRNAVAAVRLDGTAVFVGGLGAASVPLASAERFSPCGASCSTPLASCMCAECADDDGDGLSDVWETTGVDANCDGVAELDLAARGAKPDHKDVFLEIDYMEGGSPVHSHKPALPAIAKVVDAFSDSPMQNPDGTTGIALHVDVGDVLPHAEATMFNLDPACVNVASFDLLKTLYQGPARGLVYHYGVYAHFTDCGKSYNGLTQLSGGITIGHAVIPPASEAAILMHELGHSLNLTHGIGSDYAPNYLSTMNYLFSHTGIPPTGRLDFSRVELPKLDEALLDESKGIQDGIDQTYHFCKPGGPKILEDGTGPIDWDCDNTLDAAPVQADIDGSGQIGKLDNTVDWETIPQFFPDSTPGRFNFKFQCSTAGSTAAALVAPEPELTMDELRARHLLHPVLPVAIDPFPRCADDTIVLDSPLPVRVGLFGSRALDVATVDPGSLSFAGAPVQRSALADLNRDGVQDLVAAFRTRDLVLSTQSTSARLLGSLRSSQSIQGQAAIRVVDGRPPRLPQDSLSQRRCEAIPPLDWALD